MFTEPIIELGYKNIVLNYRTKVRSSLINIQGLGTV